MGKVVQIRDHRSKIREQLGLSTRLANRLADAGIFTLGDLLHRSWADLDNIRGLGSYARRDIRGALAAQGLWLPRHTDRPVPEQHTATNDERALDIAVLGLAAQTVRTLQAGEVNTVGDLVDLNRADLLRIPGVGPVMVREIKAGLRERGLDLTRYYGFMKPDAPVAGDASTTIEALYYHGHLSVRALTIFEREGITTVADLVAMKPADLRAVRGIGPITFDVVQKGLRRLGFRLAGGR